MNPLKLLIHVAFIWPLAIGGWLVLFAWECLAALIGPIKDAWPKQGGKNTYGDAKFAEDLKDQGGFLLGHYKGKPVSCDPAASLIGIAKKGYGKSLTLGASIRREKKAHLVILDASGTIYEKHREELIANGYDVGCINLTDPDNSHTYDPMTYFRHTTKYRWGVDVETFGQLAVQPDRETKEAHWIESARNIFMALVRAEAEHAKQLGTLDQVAAMLLAKEEKDLEKHLKILKAFNNDTINIAIRTVERVSEKEKSSFFSTLARKVTPWTDPAIKALAKGKWCWEDVFRQTKPQAIFLITGIENQAAIAPYTRLFIGLAVASAGRWHSTHNGPIPNGLKIYVDEADLIGNCPPIAEAITKQRKVGVNVCLFYQSLSQLEKNMEDSKSILDNSDLWLTGGLNDDALLQRVSRLIGQKTITTTVKGKHGDSEREEGVPLITPEKIRALSIDQCLALVGTQTAMLDKAYIFDKKGFRWR